MVVLCCGLNLLMIRKIPRMSVYPSLLRYLTKNHPVEWQKKRLSVIHNRVSSNRARFWLWNWFEVSIVPLGMCNFHACSIGIASVLALAKQYHTSSAEIINLTSKWESIFVIFIYILKWYSYTDSWSIFLIGKILMLFFFFFHPNYTS